MNFTYLDPVISLPSLQAKDAAIISDTYLDGDDGRKLTTYSICALAESEYRLFSTSTSRTAERMRHSARSDSNYIYDFSKIRIATVTEAPEKHYHFLLASLAHCSSAQILDLVLARETKILRGACLRKKSLGWWNYELCVGVSVRQYRQAMTDTERKTKTHFLFGGSDDEKKKTNEQPKESGFTIGTFRNETAVLVQPDLSRGRPPPGSLLRPERIQVYDQGEICDLTGSPRTATVHFRCDRAAGNGIPKTFFFDSNKPPYITTITESSTCNYDIVVALPAACALEDASVYHPSYSYDADSFLDDDFNEEDEEDDSSSLLRYINCFPGAAVVK